MDMALFIRSFVDRLYLHHMVHTCVFGQVIGLLLGVTAIQTWPIYCNLYNITGPEINFQWKKSCVYLSSESYLK